MSKCEVPKCKDKAEITYYGHDVCNKCHGKHCDKKIDLKKIFNIKDQQKMF